LSTNPQPDAVLAPSDSGTAPLPQLPVAPNWHTVTFLVVVVVFATVSAIQHAGGAGRSGHVFTYLFTIGWEWLLVAFILWGTRKRGVSLKELVGGRWSSPEDALLDVAVAVGFWIVAALVLFLAAAALGLADPAKLETAKKAIDVLKPNGVLESALWVCLSLTAGFCEEVMFRGYVQKQFIAWTHSEIAAVLLQAVVFGAAHSYQGARLALVVTVYGMMFGVLAAMRHSLRPGMMAHAMQDTLSGLVRNIPIR
jgi:membrane protease YdiL (CAAX protease family)